MGSSGNKMWEGEDVGKLGEDGAYFSRSVHVDSGQLSPVTVTSADCLLFWYRSRSRLHQWKLMSLYKEKFMPCFFLRKEEGGVLLLCLLFPNCLPLKITLLPKGHVLNWRVLIPFRTASCCLATCIRPFPRSKLVQMTISISKPHFPTSPSAFTI